LDETILAWTFLRFTNDVDKFALDGRVPPVEVDLCYLIIGLTDSTNFDVPDVLAGHANRLRIEIMLHLNLVSHRVLN
jgi:hypothetical protein